MEKSGLPASGVHGLVAYSRDAISLSPERTYLDRPDLGDGVPCSDLDSLFEAVALDDVEPTDGLLRLGEGAALTTVFPSRTGTERPRRGGASWSPMTHWPRACTPSSHGKLFSSRSDGSGST